MGLKSMSGGGIVIDTVGDLPASAFLLSLFPAAASSGDDVDVDDAAAGTGFLKMSSGRSAGAGMGAETDFSRAGTNFNGLPVADDDGPDCCRCCCCCCCCCCCWCCLPTVAVEGTKGATSTGTGVDAGLSLTVGVCCCDNDDDDDCADVEGGAACWAVGWLGV